MQNSALAKFFRIGVLCTDSGIDSLVGVGDTTEFWTKRTPGFRSRPAFTFTFFRLVCPRTWLIQGGELEATSETLMVLRSDRLRSGELTIVGVYGIANVENPCTEGLLGYDDHQIIDIDRGSLLLEPALYTGGLLKILHEELPFPRTAQETRVIQPEESIEMGEGILTWEDLRDPESPVAYRGNPKDNSSRFSKLSYAVQNLVNLAISLNTMTFRNTESEEVLEFVMSAFDAEAQHHLYQGATPWLKPRPRSKR